MTRPAPLPHELGEHFRVRDAVALGSSPGRLRRSDLVQTFHGVRSHHPPETVAQAVQAYLPLLPDRGFFSHLTAAALWGLPLPANADPRLHVSYPHGCRPVRRPGVAGHHLVMRADEITVLDGVPVTTAERTWCDLAPWLGFESLVAAGDRAVWRRDPLTTIDGLTDMARRHPDRRHRARRLAALPMICERSDSPPETTLRLRFHRAGLPRPDLNVDVTDAAGRFLGRPDLAFTEFRELVDYEGDGHRTDRHQWWNDVARVPRFEAAGWHTHRATTPDLADGSRRLILAVARSLHDKGWRGDLRL